MYIKMDKYGRHISVVDSLPYNGYHAGKNVYYDSFYSLYLEFPGSVNSSIYRNYNNDIDQVGNVKIYYDNHTRAIQIGDNRLYHNNDGLIIEINGIRVYYNNDGEIIEIGGHRVN